MPAILHCSEIALVILCFVVSMMCSLSLNPSQCHANEASKHGRDGMLVTHSPQKASVLLPTGAERWEPAPE